MKCFKCHFDVKPEESIYGLHSECFTTWFSVESSEPFQDVIVRQAESKEPQIKRKINSNIISCFFQGKFKKYSTKLGQKNYILKVREMPFDELPATEYLCNEIARELHLDIPNFYFVLFEGLPTFVCENFMRYHDASNLIHIYHFLEESDQYDCETLYNIILNKTQRLEDAYRFIDLTLFDALIGNHDRHGRNIALIQSPRGYKLSPFYDNPCYLGIEEDFLLSANHEPRGKIATRDDINPTIIDYIIEWDRLNLRNRVIDFFNRIDMSKIIGCIERSIISEKRKIAIARVIENRFKEYKNAVE